eukprot:6252622-Prymnesium_polylepis.2
MASPSAPSPRAVAVVSISAAKPRLQSSVSAGRSSPLRLWTSTADRWAHTADARKATEAISSDD